WAEHAQPSCSPKSGDRNPGPGGSVMILVNHTHINCLTYTKFLLDFVEPQEEGETRYGSENRKESDRDRPRYDQFRRFGDGGRGSGGHRQSGRLAADALDRRVRQRRRAAGRTDSQTPGSDQSGEHRLFDQAFHGEEGRRGLQRAEARALSNHRVTEWRRVGRSARQAVLAARSVGDGAPEVEAGGRRLPR